MNDDYIKLTKRRKEGKNIFYHSDIDKVINKLLKIYFREIGEPLKLRKKIKDIIITYQ